MTFIIKQVACPNCGRPVFYARLGDRAGYFNLDETSLTHAVNHRKRKKERKAQNGDS